VTVQEHVHTSAPTRKNVDVYDFRRPTTLAREHSRVLELAFETFARQWGTQMTAKVRVVSHVTSEQVSMATYDEYAASLPPTTAMVLCEFEGSAAKAVIQFPTSAALSWVTYMLGGNASKQVDDRKFTQIEQALVRKLMEDALEDLRYSLGRLLVTSIAIDTIHYNSQFAQAAATTELMIVARFEIRVGENSTHATLAIPADVLLPQLGEANPTSTTANAKELMRSQLAHTPVELALQLAPVNVKPNVVLRLAVGDLITLPHPTHRPMNIAVDGQPLAQAAVGANGSRLACVVVGENSSSAPTMTEGTSR
jgi:flagellar motor switch protein FliM